MYGVRAQERSQPVISSGTDSGTTSSSGPSIAGLTEMATGGRLQFALPALAKIMRRALSDSLREATRPDGALWQEPFNARAGPDLLTSLRQRFFSAPRFCSEHLHQSAID